MIFEGVFILGGFIKISPWSLYWGPRTIAVTFWSKSIVLWGLFYWFTWTYSPEWRQYTFFWSTILSRNICLGPFVLDCPAPGFGRGREFRQKTAGATIWTLIHLEVCLKGIDYREDKTHSLKVQLNHSILGTCYFLDAQLMEIPISAIYVLISLTSLSVCMWVILKPRFRYSLLTCLIPSSTFSIFRF